MTGIDRVVVLSRFEYQNNRVPRSGHLQLTTYHRPDCRYVPTVEKLAERNDRSWSTAVRMEELTIKQAEAHASWAALPSFWGRSKVCGVCRPEVTL